VEHVLVIKRLAQPVQVLLHRVLLVVLVGLQMLDQVAVEDLEVLVLLVLGLSAAVVEPDQSAQVSQMDMVKAETLVLDREIILLAVVVALLKQVLLLRQEALAVVEEAQHLAQALLQLLVPQIVAGVAVVTELRQVDQAAPVS